MNQFGLNIVWTMILSLIFVNPSSACMRAMPVNNLPKKLVNFQTCEALSEHLDKVNKNSPGSFGAKRLQKGSIGSFNSMSFGDGQSALSGPAGAPLRKAQRDFKEVKSETKVVVGTNNQVLNVDEADFVKFNGEQIFQIHKGSLKILKAWPASEMNLLSSIKLSGDPKEMLFNTESVIVLANKGTGLIVSIISIEKLSAPKVLTEFEIPGNYKTARLVGNTLRIVNQESAFHNSFWKNSKQVESFWFNSGSIKKIVNIKPTIQVSDQVRKEIDASQDCKNVYVPEKAQVTNLTRIISIDLKRKDYSETLAYINPEVVYASEENLYLAGSGHDSKGHGLKTSFHKFSIDQGKTAKYLATGVVMGSLINQFAMDEHKNYLRLAAYGSSSESQWKTVSRIHVFKQKGQTLKDVGRTKDMGQGEKLYSVKFDGEKAYAVTFRQIDPLYTVDMSRPHHPKVIGELKIPGFSTYIHKIDSTHLLTIGKDADAKTGRTRGLKLSIFDVRDFKQPKEVTSLIFKGDVHSEASFDHKAFSFYRQKGILAIPATSGSVKSSLLLFKVSQEGIKHSGELNMTDMFVGPSKYEQVRRSFFADDTVYAIAGNGVRSAKIESPEENLSTITFDNTFARIEW